MRNIRIDKLFFHDSFSQLPIYHNIGTAEIHELNSLDEIELCEGEYITDIGDDLPTVSYRKRWITTRGSLTEAYKQEWIRITKLAQQIAPKIEVQSEISLVPSGIQGIICYKADEKKVDEYTEFFSRKVNRLLRTAVENSGMDPNPFGPMIFNRTHWHFKLRSVIKSLLNSCPTRIAWFSPEYIPVLSAALKELNTNQKDRGRTVTLRYQFASLSEVPTLICQTKEYLDNNAIEWNLDSYLQISSFLEEQNQQFVSGEKEQEMKVLFFQPSSGTEFKWISIGMEIPKPDRGFPIKLTNGEIEWLPRPPWSLGQTINPRTDRKGSKKCSN
ncbi:hypothetical protein MSKOL_0683 [Methanosarcina sp. Kolksee]|uniref:hypothetical protein n=1 Tax=Methanosarcina sp. Kolksee TaxID=1434099 RepID=UPI0006154B18|nr:hypothetical protein [Methanosarcina sp. Kolksee]AKB46460.1 hypothetical protein MSKOL_0683 [Methanosarcina sp. Kolksee]